MPLQSQSPGKGPRNSGPCEGFDESSGNKWIYPNNMQIRGYQKTAVEMALFNNAMIVLPTGFGKTFIAAVVMYNFYRWYPDGTIIFVAPTRPLVTQQIEECKRISGIPSSACKELTGMISTEKRRALWLERRVIFATPQVIENDLNSGILPCKKVRLIVIDEAHRAQGGYAYVNIIRFLHENNMDGFRVLALSATPGSDIQKVQQVMLNLYIGEVMFRSETSIDLAQFSNNKVSRAWKVILSGMHEKLVERMKEVTRPIYQELHKAGLTFHGTSIDTVAKYTLVKALTQANNNELARAGTAKGRLKFLCAAAMSLSNSFEMLTLYGLRVFYASAQRSMSETRSAMKSVMLGKVEFDKILLDIKNIFGDDIEINPDKEANVDLVQGHPKLDKVKKLLLDHFDANANKTETRAIVFSKYRDSVFDIVQTLRSCQPLLKPAAFVGQGSGGKTGPGMSQKEQGQLIKDFKAGVYNVIVATCVGEEGLDIGEVDLIINYDVSSSPISSTQRRGRTGRKRSGNVHTICTHQYEDRKLSKAGESRRQVESQLFKRENYINYKYRNQPRMVPSHIQPECLEMRIMPINDEPEEDNKKKRGARKNQTDGNGDAELTSSLKKHKATNGGESSQKKKKKKKCSEDEEEEWEPWDVDEQPSFKSAADMLHSGSESPEDLWD